MKKKNIPIISVILPVYNGEKYLRLALESVLRQTLADFELIIINDGSTDKSEEIILSYPDPRITYIKNPKNMGLIFTLNKGLYLSKGQYIARMDTDDISELNRFESQVKIMDNCPEVSVCGTWARAIDENGNFLFVMKSPSGWLLKYNYWKPSPLIHPSVMIRKSHLKNFRFGTVPVVAEDYDLWLKLSQEYHLYNVQKCLLSYRFHSSSISHTKRQLQLVSSYNSFRHVIGFKNISFDQYKSLSSVEFNLGVVERWKLSLKLGEYINYPFWFSLVDNFVYWVRKTFYLRQKYYA